ASSRREERPAHGQEPFGTPTPVHPHRIRTSPRRIVLPHPAMRRAGSQRRAPEGMVRRHDAVSGRPLRRAGRAAARRAARPGRAVLPSCHGAERDGGRGGLSRHAYHHRGNRRQRRPTASRTPPPRPSSAYHPATRPGAASTPSPAGRSPAPRASTTIAPAPASVTTRAPPPPPPPPVRA